MSVELAIVVTEVGTDETNAATPQDALTSGLETARDRLANRLDPSAVVEVRSIEVGTHSPDSEDRAARLEALREEIRDLVGDTDEVDDLSEEDRRQLEELREQYYFHERLQEVRPTPDYAPALVVTGVSDVSPETVAAAVFDPLEPLDPTTVVDGAEVTPFTETAIAEAVAAATPRSGGWDATR